MKKLAKLKAVKTLNKVQQKTINGGGGVPCNDDIDCRHLGACFICTSIGVCFEPFNSNC